MPAPPPARGRLLELARPSLRLDPAAEARPQLARSCAARCCRAATPCSTWRANSKPSTPPTSRERQREMDRRIADFERSGRRSLMLVVGARPRRLGFAASYGSPASSRRAERQHLATERAEHELRRLSQQLVRAQEDERRNLSRELHDEVGQTLTALRVELGNLEKLRAGPPETLQRAPRRRQATSRPERLGSVRNLAMGLRPSMLDDLGLGPAPRMAGARIFAPHRRPGGGAARRRSRPTCPKPTAPASTASCRRR